MKECGITSGVANDKKECRMSTQKADLKLVE